ncbi:MAG: protein kinase [Planctomycetes bacterium]|nr:protein kinase [Planctomycetota bacterium]
MSSGDTLGHESVYTLPGGGPPGQGDTTKRTPPGLVLPLPGVPGPAEAPSRRVGGYELLNELGRGGMGSVWRARSLALGREVALKLLTAADDPELVERFQLEARAAARLKHPNVVGVHEVGREGRTWFLAMDLVEGESLRARIVRDGPLPPREAARVLEAVGRALHHAHGLSVIHRDVKPHNIMLAADGTPLLTDFGLAKDIGASGVTATGDVLGTPAYMAPEQAMGDPARVDRRADVYALGATLYEALTGRPPFAGPSAMNVLRQVIEDEPSPPSRRRPGLDRDLEAICLKCLEKEPAARYDTAGLAAGDLARWLRHEPIAARRAGPIDRAVRWARRRPAATLALVLVALLSFGALAALVGARVNDARQREVARAEEARRLAAARAAALEAGERAARAPGSAFERRQAAQEALEAARAWRALAPDAPEALARLRDAATRVGDLSRAAEDFGGALAAYTLASGLAPEDEPLALAVRAAGALVAAAERRVVIDPHGELEALTAAVDARPDWPQAWLLRGEHHRAQVRAGLALADLDRTIELEPLPRALDARFRLRFATGNVRGAREDFERCAEALPDSVFLRLERARQLASSGDVDAGLAELDECLRRFPDHPAVLVERGRQRLNRGQRAAGLADLEAAMAAPGAEQDPVAWHALAMARVNAGDLGGGLTALDRAITAGGTGSDHHALRADILTGGAPSRPWSGPWRWRPGSRASCCAARS